MNACWRGWSLPFSARPSIVNTDRPRTSKASVVQALTGRPSTSSVQAPQTSTSQDRFTPVRPSRSRTTSSSNSWGSTSISCERPFNVNDTGMNCASCCLDIALDMPVSGIRTSRPASAHQTLKSALQQHAYDMFFIFLGAVQITDCFSRTTSDDTRGGQISHRLLGAFPIEQSFGFGDASGRRPGTAYGDLRVTYGSGVYGQRQRDPNARSLKIAKLQISAPGVCPRSRNSNFREHFIRFE